VRLVELESERGGYGGVKALIILGRRCGERGGVRGTGEEEV